MPQEVKAGHGDDRRADNHRHGREVTPDPETEDGAPDQRGVVERGDRHGRGVVERLRRPVLRYAADQPDRAKQSNSLQYSRLRDCYDYYLCRVVGEKMGTYFGVVLNDPQRFKLWRQRDEW
jgi:hypothetical protein